MVISSGGLRHYPHAEAPQEHQQNNGLMGNHPIEVYPTSSHASTILRSIETGFTDSGQHLFNHRVNTPYRRRMAPGRVPHPRIVDYAREALIQSLIDGVNGTLTPNNIQMGFTQMLKTTVNRLWNGLKNLFGY